MGQDAALEEGVELVLDEPRQFSPGAGLGVGDETGRMLLHQAVQRGLLGAVAFVVERGAIGRPLGLERAPRRLWKLGGFNREYRSMDDEVTHPRVRFGEGPREQPSLVAVERRHRIAHELADVL